MNNNKRRHRVMYQGTEIASGSLSWCKIFYKQYRKQGKLAYIEFAD